MYYHWIAFLIFVLSFLAIDMYRSLWVLEPISFRSAVRASCQWIVLALLFCGLLYFSLGEAHAIDFITGYLVEKSLSVDNLFVFLLIFTHFRVPDKAREYVLFYGVLGAIVFRMCFILAGVSLVEYFHWAFTLFGLLLIASGVKLLRKENRNNIEKTGVTSFIHSWIKKRVPYTETYHGTAFFVIEKKKWVATPLVAVLILVETNDLFFAFDSIPAILGITTDRFIVFTSNVFAILGLRSLYFALQGMMEKFHFLHYALSFILVFIGSKMLLAGVLEIPTWVTLVVVTTSLTVATVASLYGTRRN